MDFNYDMWNITFNPPQQLGKNKFIFINKEKESMLPKGNTVHVNPRFKENKTVYLNPKFQMVNVDPKPSIHINPNVLKSVSSIPKSKTIIPLLRNIEDKGSVISGNQVVHTSKFGICPGKRLVNSTLAISTNSKALNMAQQVVSTGNLNYTMNKRYNPYNKVNNNTAFKKTNASQQKIQLSANPIVHPVPASMNPVINIQKLNQRYDIVDEQQRKVHTRLKIVNVSQKSRDIVETPIESKKTVISDREKSIRTRYKYVRREPVSPKQLAVNNRNSSRRKSSLKKFQVKRPSLDNSQRKIGIMTRYKYIRTGEMLSKTNKAPLKSKYKIVNNGETATQQKDKSIVKSNPSLYKKKFVYLNKYNSSSFLANNVILKNSKQRNLIKINGILYKNSPCLLKKTSVSSKGKVAVRQIVSKGKYKIVRSQLASASKLKKSNMTCPIYRRTGKCKGLENGKCIKVHNPNLIMLCRRFLRGECRNDNCLLSHKVSSEKMPTCKYFLEGSCNKVGCQYLHVKISSKAEICKDFLEGFCNEGIKCDKRHMYLCPEYEKFQKCLKSKCPYPHGSSEVNKPKLKKRNLKKIVQQKIIKPIKSSVEETNQIRYYDDKVDKTTKSEKESNLKRSNTDDVPEMSLPKRKKLGSLPSFIPIL